MPNPYVEKEIPWKRIVIIVILIVMIIFAGFYSIRWYKNSNKEEKTKKERSADQTSADSTDTTSQPASDTQTANVPVPPASDTIDQDSVIVMVMHPGDTLYDPSDSSYIVAECCAGK